MKKLSQHIKNTLYDLEYKIQGQDVDHFYCKGREAALTFLSTKRNIEYAFLFKPGTTNTTDIDSLRFWYSDEESNNYWNNIYKDESIKESLKKKLEEKHIHHLK